MADVPRIIEEIRSFLRPGRQAPLEALRPLAQEYKEACQEANRRLARCEEFLRQGLRAEAIHFADAKPNLLELLAVLDFPERPAWEQVAAQHQLPVPPALRFETAVALNQAYAQAAPLEDLLKRHRLLALARAPLGERLAVMRQIAKLDGDNPVWDEDIVAFEKARLAQLQEEMDQLARQFDTPPLSQVESLADELQGAAWRTPPPQDMLATIREMVATGKQASLQERMQQLARDLVEAHRNKDEGLAQMLAPEWRRLAIAVSDDAEIPLLHRANEAVQWLDKLDRQRARVSAAAEAFNDLRQALANRRTSLERLEKRYLEAAAHKVAIPADLEQAYRERLRQAAAADSRWQALVLMAVFAVGAVALVGFFVFLITRNR
jgi:hypothetical protein